MLTETKESNQAWIELRQQVNYWKAQHERKKYVSDCKRENASIITAPPALKLMAKGMFSIDFWIHILTEKYLFQRPLHRIPETLKLEGLAISQGIS